MLYHYMNYNMLSILNLLQSTDESEMFIDLNSVRSVEHNPPNYTLLFNVYLVEYKKKQTIEWVVTADYDYEYSCWLDCEKGKSERLFS